MIERSTDWSSEPLAPIWNVIVFPEPAAAVAAAGVPAKVPPTKSAAMFATVALADVAVNVILPSPRNNFV